MFNKVALAMVFTISATSAFAQSGAAQFQAYKLSEAIDEKCQVLTLESRSVAKAALRQMLFTIMEKSNSAEGYNQAEAVVQKKVDSFLVNGCSPVSTTPEIMQSINWVNSQGDFATAVLHELPATCTQYGPTIAQRGPAAKARLLATGTTPAQRQGMQASLDAQTALWSEACINSSTTQPGAPMPYSDTPMAAANLSYRHLKNEPDDVTDAKSLNPWKFRRSDDSTRTLATIDDWGFLTGGSEYDLLISFKADGSLTVEARDGTRLRRINVMVLEVKAVEADETGKSEAQQDEARLQPTSDDQKWTLSKDVMDDLLARYDEKEARSIDLRIDMSAGYTVYPGLTGSDYRMGRLSFSTLKSGLTWAQAPKI